jgi:hypothetical protein
MARKQKLGSEALPNPARARRKTVQLELPLIFTPPRKARSTLMTDYARSLPSSQAKGRAGAAASPTGGQDDE